jgi:putative chitinase
MHIYKQKLLAIAPHVPADAIDPINAAIERMRVVEAAGFLSTILVESDQCRRLEENLNYSAEALLRTWPRRFDATTAAAYARKPQKIAERVYSGRMGNARPGDGWLYRGRGYMQHTGHDNYAALARALGLPLEEQPDLLLQPTIAMRAALVYWHAHHFGTLCPWRNKPSQPWLELCVAVNGGTHGLATRAAYAQRLLAVMV